MIIRGFLFLLCAQIARKLQRPPLDLPQLSSDGGSTKESPTPAVKPAAHSAPAYGVNEDAANALSENMRKLEVSKWVREGVGLGNQKTIENSRGVKRITVNK